MPQVLDTIDRLAAKYHQDILMADFLIAKKQSDSVYDSLTFKWDEKAQKTFTKWMQKELPDIHCERVFPLLSASIILIPYMGHIGIIVSEADQPAAYRRIVEYWEYADGTPRFDHTRLFYVPVDSEKLVNREAYD